MLFFFYKTKDANTSEKELFENFIHCSQYLLIIII